MTKYSTGFCHPHLCFKDMPFVAPNGYGSKRRVRAVSDSQIQCCLGQSISICIRYLLRVNLHGLDQLIQLVDRGCKHLGRGGIQKIEETMTSPVVVMIGSSLFRILNTYKF